MPKKNNTPAKPALAPEDALFQAVSLCLSLIHISNAIVSIFPGNHVGSSPTIGTSS